MLVCSLTSKGYRGDGHCHNSPYVCKGVTKLCLPKFGLVLQDRPTSVRKGKANCVQTTKICYQMKIILQMRRLAVAVN